MRRWVVVAVVTLVVLAAAGGEAWWLLRPKARPDPAAAAYLEAWGRRDWPAMQARVAAPPADFAAQHTAMAEALRVTGASFTPGTATVHDDRAEVPFQARLTLRALGAWSYQGLLRLVRRDDRWRVDWSPATLHPDLAAGQRFQRTRTWPDRAPILAADGSQLAGPGPTVTISVVGGRVKDPGQVGDALVAHARVPRAVARKALAEAERRPDQAVPVTTLPKADYDLIRAAIHPVPGLSFEQAVGREYNGPPTTRTLLGSVGPVTADDLKARGAPYQTGDQAGHGNGLEEAFERRLAGTPTGEVRLVGRDGHEPEALGPTGLGDRNCHLGRAKLGKGLQKLVFRDIEGQVADEKSLGQRSSFPPVCAASGAGDVCGQRAPEEGEARRPVEGRPDDQPGALSRRKRDPDRAGPQRNTRDRTIRLTTIRADTELLLAVYQIGAMESSKYRRLGSPGAEPPVYTIRTPLARANQRL